MRSRRTAITLLAVLILVVGALSAAERDRTRDKTATAPAVPAQAQTQKTGRQVVATLPADSPVRAKVGDSVVLRVKSDTPDIAQMLQLGLSWSVGPKLPGTMQYVADAPGTFAVTLEVAGTVGGIVQVR